jgi:cold-inducible RNA-binding protein
MTMTRLFVGNLSFEVTQSDLREAFAAYGPVSEANIVADRANGRSTGFGFVEMPWEAHAVAAIQGLDGTDLKGRSINVSRARPLSDGGSRGNPPRGWDVAGDGGMRERNADGN